jgi:hypothetical protein
MHTAHVSRLDTTFLLFKDADDLILSKPSLHAMLLLLSREYMLYSGVLFWSHVNPVCKR